MAAASDRLQHLEVWEIDSSAADSLRGLNALNLSGERFEEFGKECLSEVVKAYPNSEWAAKARREIEQL